MQGENVALFVKRDLLLQEKGFEQLRECVSSLTPSQLNDMCHFQTIDYCSEIDRVCLCNYHTRDAYDSSNYIAYKICVEGFVIIDFYSLKQMLSL